MASLILCGILFGTYLLLEADKAYGEEVILLPLDSMVTENSSLELICQYRGNGTVNVFKWLRWNDVIDSTVATVTVQTDHCQPTSSDDITPCEFSCRNNHINVWTIRQVTRDLIGFSYQCKVEKRKGSLGLSSNIITPDVKLPVKGVSITKPNNRGVIIMESNIEIDIQCETSGEYPGAEISWYKDPNTPYDPTDDTLISSKVETASENISEYLERTVSVLTFCRKPGDAEMGIYCSANNINDKVPVVSRQRVRFGMKQDWFMDHNLILILACSLVSLCGVLIVYSVFVTVVICKNRRVKKLRPLRIKERGDSLNASNAYSNVALYDRPNVSKIVDIRTVQEEEMYSSLTQSINNIAQTRDAIQSKVYENIPKHMVSFQ